MSSHDWRQAPPPAHPQSGQPVPPQVNPQPVGVRPRPGWQPGPMPGQWVQPSALPVVATSYVQFMRAPRWRWWRGGLLALCLLFGMFVLGSIPVGIAFGIDLASGRTTLEELNKSLASGDLPITPAVFLANNVGLALLIPWCMLMAWACTGQRPRWLSSVVGRLRWRWLWTIAALIIPVWLIALALELTSSWAHLHPGPDTVVLIIGIVLTQPLQAAGEEYFFRGLFPRIVGAWIRPEKIALAAAWVSSSVVFMMVHGAGDIYLNIFYFTFGMIASWLTWRSGGLEAAIAIHVVNNLISMVPVPFTDLSTIFDREAGTVTDVSQILPTLFTLVAALVIVEVMIRRRKPVRLGPPQPPGNPPTH